MPQNLRRSRDPAKWADEGVCPDFVRIPIKAAGRRGRRGGDEEHAMIRDVMVHLDGSPEDEVRLDHGQSLASAARSYLIGMFTNPIPDLAIAMPVDGGGAAMVQVLTEMEERARKEGDAVAQRLAERLAGLQVPAELRRVDAAPASLAGKVTQEARCADLFLATRPYGNTGTPEWANLVEDVLFGSGRALLVIPPGHRPEPIGTALIAWNGSREAARALREGMDIVARATRVIVLIVDPERDTKPWAEVERHLSHHGVNAQIVPAESGGRPIAQVILDGARAVSADLVVMGGYGHTRLRERVFGGATMDMLTRSEMPILMAH
jgi:nucleotide-binding universal stress UspA family protein